MIYIFKNLMIFFLLVTKSASIPFLDGFFLNYALMKTVSENSQTVVPFSKARDKDEYY